MSRRVRCHLRMVSAHLHIAPLPRALLAGVVEVQHAITAFANLRPIKVSEQRGDALRNRPKQVLGFARITIRVSPEARFCDNQSGPPGVAGLCLAPGERRGWRLCEFAWLSPSSIRSIRPFAMV